MDSAPLTDDSLWLPEEAAAFLRVSKGYLRASDCPKALLPGNGPKGQPLVRYRQSEVREWAEHHTVRRSITYQPKAAPSKPVSTAGRGRIRRRRSL